jgi:hypothetical protein
MAAWVWSGVAIITASISGCFSNISRKSRQRLACGNLPKVPAANA